jgi:hypothetical protein
MRITRSNCGTKDRKKIEDLDAAIEMYEAAQMWAMAGMKSAGINELQAAWLVLDSEGHEVPLEQQLYFCSMFAESLAEDLP